jgi:malate dehydrogenase (oxaloacetate-decarboxylating)
LRSALIAEGLAPDEATGRIWCVDRYGLITDDQDNLRDFQRTYARHAAETADWQRDGDLGGITLAETVRRVRPTVLIGTSGQGGAFTEPIVREMAAHAKRPIILPMSNPTDLAEATPADLIEWTGGTVLVATGSPFAAVEYRGVTHQIGQANNALIFPALGLGAVVARARRITDGMLAAAAHAVARQTDATAPGAPLLPLIDRLYEVSMHVAVAVARAAAADGVAGAEVDDSIEQRIRAAVWEPAYQPIVGV